MHTFCCDLEPCEKIILDGQAYHRVIEGKLRRFCSSEHRRNWTRLKETRERLERENHDGA